MKLTLSPLGILREPVVHAALAQAWTDSKPGLSGGHEEGGFIVLDSDNKLGVQRWPKGEGNRITVPNHDGCAVGAMPIVATFHTHPNTGPDYLQEPSETDRRGVKDDSELKAKHYIGEFVIADEMIYLITPGGAVREVDSRSELLG